MSNTPNTPQKTKPWYQSKTLWFNVLVGAGSTIAGAAGVNVAALSEIVTPAIAAINVLLRAYSQHALTR